VVLAAALGGLGLGGVAAWRAARRRRAAIAPAPAKPERWQEMLIAASNLAHGEIAMSTLAALARRVREAERVPALADGLGEVVDGFTNESAVKIQKLVEVAAELRGAQASARDTGHLLAAARAVVARMRDRAGRIVLPADPEPAAEQFLALASAADQLRDDVLAVFDCDVPHAVERALAACRADLRQLGPVAVSVVVDRDPSGAVEPATVWPDELAQVLCDLTRNALEAMRGAREPRLELRVSWLPRGVAIRVTDSGRGLPRERWEAIFAGGGTGLPNARATLAFYRGSLGVEWSEPGQGTTMLVELARRRTSRMRPVKLVPGPAGRPRAARVAGG
jgi:signal transduction histidine kinase